MYFNIGLFNLLCLSQLISLASSKCNDTHFHCFESGDKTDDCNNNISWIKLSKLCNGKLDCPNGEDEAPFVCKQHTKFQVFRTYFNCANGAVIDKELTCDGKPNDCSDNSDELNCGHKASTVKKLQGNCRELQIECLPGECKDYNNICDGKHDCSNGLDESLELCMDNCNELQFQCGNGKCVPSQLQCDGNYHCPDGADELPIVCQDNITLEQIKAPRFCEEPNGIQFANIVKTHQSKTNGSRYVLPNSPVKFVCPLTEDLIGLEWNVCGPNGKWAHPLPKCIDPSKDGCPLLTHKQGRPNLYGCTSMKANSCNVSIELMPPINNMYVRFKCNEGYQIEPEDLSTRTVACVNKTWNPTIYPKCRKV